MVQPITVLNVAEKNSVAREVARLLSDGRAQNCPISSPARYCKNLQFPFTLQGRPVNMLFTSVMGHLMELEFTPPYNSWQGCRAAELIDRAPVVKGVPKGGENEKVAQNLRSLARRAQWLVLWLDCDREGENIAFEVIQECCSVNQNLVIKRARFSALIQQDIFRAVNNLVNPNANESAAVDCRQEIDLRIGAAFTRLQSLLLQSRFDWSQQVQGNGRNNNVIISYGPCQFPTLGLIVRREWEILSHVSEPFWTIKLSYRSSDQPPKQCEFSWARDRLFDEYIVQAYHQECIEARIAHVADVRGQQVSSQAPVPLCTLELQKRASQHLRMSGDRIMHLAEQLYQGGYLSYPRTETTVFQEGYDLRGMVAAQAQTNAPWSAFASRLLQNDEFRWPRNGGADDGAHPPIHPTRPFDEQNADTQKKQLYEFVTRYFLACCAPDAQGQRTHVVVTLAEERFTATGLMVTARNWLDVYPWESWGGAGSLPVFHVGETFVPAEIRLQGGATQPPPRMRERDLLAKMDEYGIGTDATVADHIAKQLDRGYAVKDNANQTFAPTPLGQSLISAYHKMGLRNLWMPTLRGVIERNITAVARGQRTKEEVLAEAVQAFKSDFAAASSKSGILVQEVGDIVFHGAENGAGNINNTNNANVNGHGGGGGAANGAANGGQYGGDAYVPPELQSGQMFGKCSCGSALLLMPAPPGAGPYCTCAAPAGLCNWRKLLPRMTQNVTITDAICPPCMSTNANNVPVQVRKLRFRFNMSLLPPTYRFMGDYTTCIRCDSALHAMLDMVGAAPLPRPRGQQPTRGGGGLASSRGGGSRGRGGTSRSSNGRGGSQQRGGRGVSRQTRGGRGRSVT